MATQGFPVYSNYVQGSWGTVSPDFQLGLPTGTSEGDLLIAWFSSSGSPAQVSGGYTLLKQYSTTNGPTVHIFYKFAEASPSGGVFSATGSAGRFVVARVSNVGPASVPVAGDNSTNATTSGADPIAPSVTPSTNFALVLNAAFMLGNASVTNPPGTTLIGALLGDTGGWALAYEQAHAEATGTRTWAFSTGSTGSALNVYIPSSDPGALLRANGVDTGFAGIAKWTRTSGSWVPSNDGTEYFTWVDEAVTSSAADGDTGLGLGNGQNDTITGTSALTDMPSDFASMDTLSIRYSTAQVGPYVDDTGDLRANIYAADGTTLLANPDKSLGRLDYCQQGDWTLSGGTPPAYNKTLSCTITAAGLAASKADWDGAVIEFYFADITNMGSDSATIILVDFQLEGTYVSNTRTGTLNATDTRDTFSAIAEATETGLSPTKPAHPNAITITTTEVRFTWDAVAGATGYIVYRDGVEIAYNVQGLQYDDSGLTPNTLYGYRVRAILGPI